MLDRLLFPVIIAFVGVAIGIPSGITWYRRWPGFISGFDPSRCSDVSRLTRWVGATGSALALVFLIAAGVAWFVPRSIRVVSVILAVTAVIGAEVSLKGCSRFMKN